MTNDDNGQENIWVLEASKFLVKPVVKWTFRLEEAIGATPEQIHGFIQARGREILTNVPVRSYCQEVLSGLKAKGHTIHLITARSVHYRSITTQWLEKNDIPFDQLHMNPQQGSFSKGEKCSELKVEFFVDDNFENCLDVQRTGVYTLLYHSSHNREKKAPMPRVYNWHDIATNIALHLEQDIKKDA